jgi:hypothetical protein
MSRLQPDSFLPTGALLDPDEHSLSFTALGNQHTSHPSSVISPLVLPRSANHVSYFDDHQPHSIPPPNHRHTSAGTGTSQSQAQRRYLSPHRSPQATRDQHRSASLSPTRYQNQQIHNRFLGSGITSPALSAYDPSIAASPEQANQLRRVTLQNRRLLENWEAERAHLEATRSRAEEIYKEERAIMDEDRMIWADQEARYLDRIQTLEQEKASLLELVSKYQLGVSHNDQLRGAGRVGSDSPAELSSLPNGDVPFLRFRATSDSRSPGSTPVPRLGRTMPESQPFRPLDPRMQSASPQTTPPADRPVAMDRLPSIDVQEVYTNLEGIPLKATAVTKPTFTDGKPPSPPLSGSNHPSPPGSNQDSPNSRSRVSPAELTIETLQAPELHRLTMHAGHTPNHSLSLSVFHTAASTDAPNTAGSSGASTPTRDLGTQSQALPNLDQADAKGKDFARPEEAYEMPTEDGQFDVNAEHAEALLKPSDNDRELSGPLSLRNRPVHDEIFLGKVSDKLMDSIKSDNATPTVLKTGLVEPQAAPADPKPMAAAGADGTADDDESSPKDEGGDPPIIFKKGNNFGAPLGELPSS